MLAAYGLGRFTPIGLAQNPDNFFGAVRFTFHEYSSVGRKKYSHRNWGNYRRSLQTIFGTIAREMRKYYVSLLVVDQRPSSIDDEVLSQIGTRITALLNDEKDIQAVLTGVSGTEGLRSVLASLDSKQQALILGHAVPMPVVIKTRDYDVQFYRDMGCLDDLPEKERQAKVDEGTVALYGDN